MNKNLTRQRYGATGAMAEGGGMGFRVIVMVSDIFILTTKSTKNTKRTRGIIPSWC